MNVGTRADHICLPSLDAGPERQYVLCERARTKSCRLALLKSYKRNYPKTNPRRHPKNTKHPKRKFLFTPTPHTRGGATATDHSTSNIRGSMYSSFVICKRSRPRASSSSVRVVRRERHENGGARKEEGEGGEVGRRMACALGCQRLAVTSPARASSKSSSWRCAGDVGGRGAEP